VRPLAGKSVQVFTLSDALTTKFHRRRNGFRRYCCAWKAGNCSDRNRELRAAEEGKSLLKTAKDRLLNKKMRAVGIEKANDSFLDRVIINPYMVGQTIG
jgi:hypothetical protein